MSGQRSSFGRDPLHQIPVATQRIHVVIKQIEAGFVVLGAQMLAGNRHSHGIANALPKWPSRCLNTGCVAQFRMASAGTIQLAKVLDVFDGDRFCAGYFAVGIDTANACQMDHRIEQHRGMPTRQYKAVTICPFWIHGIVTKRLGPQLKRYGSQGHRSTWMAAICCLHTIHAQGSDGVDRHLAKRVSGCVHRFDSEYCVKIGLN